MTFFLACHSDCASQLAATEGEIYDSCILISSIHALTILYPSIECNLGGDIEGRRTEGDGEYIDAVQVRLHSDGTSCMLV